MNKTFIVRGSLIERLHIFKLLKKAKQTHCGTLPIHSDYHADDKFRSFTLGAEFTPSSRFYFCHESKNHGGLMSYDGWPLKSSKSKVTGLIFCLPRGRFLAGYSLGLGKDSKLTKIVFNNEYKAWSYADYLAKQEARRLNNNMPQSLSNGGVLCDVA